MSQISTLILALSVFQQNDLRVIDVNKSHPKNFHLYYKVDGMNRVMLVPKHTDNAPKLQREVETLLARSIEQQKEVGNKDGDN